MGPIRDFLEKSMNYTWRMGSQLVSVVRITPVYEPSKGHLEGEQPDP